jgi:hypothetical protein
MKSLVSRPESNPADEVADAVALDQRPVVGGQLELGARDRPRVLRRRESAVSSSSERTGPC